MENEEEEKFEMLSETDIPLNIKHNWKDIQQMKQRYDCLENFLQKKKTTTLRDERLKKIAEHLDLQTFTNPEIMKEFPSLFITNRYYNHSIRTMSLANFRNLIIDSRKRFNLCTPGVSLMMFHLYIIHPYYYSEFERMLKMKKNKILWMDIEEWDSIDYDSYSPYPWYCEKDMREDLNEYPWFEKRYGQRMRKFHHNKLTTISKLRTLENKLKRNSVFKYRVNLRELVIPTRLPEKTCCWASRTEIYIWLKKCDEWLKEEEKETLKPTNMDEKVTFMKEMKKNISALEVDELIDGELYNMWYRLKKPAIPFEQRKKRERSFVNFSRDVASTAYPPS